MKLKNLIEVQRRRIQPKYIDKRPQMASKSLMRKLDQQVIDGSITVDCSLLPKDYKAKVKHVKGSLIIKNTQSLQFFQNLQKVDKDFVCPRNKKLKSLKGGPVEVGLSYFCYDCDLRTLQGAASVVRGNFDCSSNENLQSLKGGPKKVKGSYICHQCDLRSLEGSPQKVHNVFYCAFNENLKSLKGGPKYVGLDYYCDNCGLTSLDGAPKWVGGNFHIYKNYRNFYKWQVRQEINVDGNVYVII